MLKQNIDSMLNSIHKFMFVEKSDYLSFSSGKLVSDDLTDFLDVLNLT